MQVSGLRDIPSPSITNVPAAVKFFGIKAQHPDAPIIINQPSSYLAISELVVRALDGKMFDENDINWQQYIANLPQSAAVSENSNAIVIRYQGKPYVQLNGGSWVPLSAVNEKGRRMLPLRPRSAHAATKGRQIPTGWLLAVIHQLTMMLTRMPAITGAARSSQAPGLTERASYSRLVAMAAVRGYPQVVQV